MDGPDSHTESDRRFHDATAHLYDATLAPIFGAYQDTVVARLLDRVASRAPGRQTVDAGCGTGIVTVALARRGLTVCGVDHSMRMLEHARARARREVPAADIRFMRGDIRSLPFPDESVDCLTCQGVLHHLQDIPVAVAEFARVLRPGGVFYLAEPCRGSNLGLRAWRRGRSLLPRRRSEPSGERPEVDVPAHEEGPIDDRQLLAALEAVGLQAEAEYWSRYEGLERLPRPLYVLGLRALTRPWRKRSGDLVFVTGSKRASGSAGSPRTARTSAAASSPKRTL